MMDVLQLKEMTDRAEMLREKVANKFSELDLSDKCIPVNMQPDDGPIKLVFVGQYSAGKSSLIQMISGIKTEIGAAITTQKATPYPWGDLEIIDTPGIETGLCKDHDEITYAEIDKAALLVFVITNEGFDKHMGDHFRKLAIDQHRGDHMILVINKMDRAPKGNSKEQQDLLREDMNKVIYPYTHEQLYTSFVSTELYNEAMEETDEELKNDLLIESGYNELIKNINAFVKEKGITAKLAQPLYALGACLNRIEVNEKAFTELDKQEEVLKRTKRVYDAEKEEALEAIQYETMGMQSDVINIGVRVANDIIGTGMTEKEADIELSKASKQAFDIVNDCARKMDDIFSNMIKSIQLNIDEISRSKIAVDMFNMYLPKVYEEPINKKDNEETFDNISKLGKKVMDISMKNNSGVYGALTASMKDFSGTLTHGGILKVGKFFGAKFKPWEAVKYTKYSAYFGAALSVVGVLYQIFQLSKAKEEEAKHQKEMDEAREKIKTQFREWAEKAYGDISKQAREQLAAIMDKPQENLENDLVLITEARGKMEVIEPIVKDLQDDVSILLNELENCRG